MTRLAVIPGLDPATYQRHFVHAEERTWVEKNCYVDIWLEVVHALGADPMAMLPFVVALDFEGDQWTFFKPPHDELRDLYGIDVQELNVWRPLLDHTLEHLAHGKLIMNAEKQLRAIYEPLVGLASDTLRAAFSIETWSQVGLGLYEWVGLGEWERTRRIPWRLGVLILLAALATSWVAWRWRAPGQKQGNSWFARWGTARRQRVIVDFYDKLETLLARHRRPRPQQSTQLEFAKATRDWLAASSDTRAVAEVPVDLAQVFYRVRFGGSPLDSAERKLVEQSLAQLSTALAARR